MISTAGIFFSIVCFLVPILLLDVNDPLGPKKITKGMVSRPNTLLHTSVLVAIHSGIYNHVHSSRRAYYSALFWRAGVINIQLKKKHKTGRMRLFFSGRRNYSLFLGSRTIILFIRVVGLGFHLRAASFFRGTLMFISDQR